MNFIYSLYTCTCTLSFKFDVGQSFPETAIKGGISLYVTLSAKYRYMYSTVLYCTRIKEWHYQWKLPSNNCGEESRIHDRTVARDLEGMLYRVKLARPLPADRNRPDVLQKRVEYGNWFMGHAVVDHTVFIDECGYNTVFVPHEVKDEL